LAWKERAQQRLLAAYERCYGGLTALRQWAMYVSSGTQAEAGGVADAIVARGQQWRPVAVGPERVTTAVNAIQPALIVVDSRLPDPQRVVEEVRLCSAATILSDRELIAEGPK
jgi:hypothetical protein